MPAKSLFRNGAWFTRTFCTGSRPLNSVWFQRLIARPQARARMFCFPYAGASAAAFRLWPAGVPAELEVVAVQLPGHGSRFSEPPLASIPALVDSLMPVLRSYMDLPFVFFGHSMGALLASEVARTLTICGDPTPGHLVVSGRRPPHINSPEPLLHHLPDAQFLTEINLRYGGIPPEILQHADVLELLLPSLRADMTAIETFLPSRSITLPCPIYALGGADDKLTPREHLEAWRGETSSTFRLRTFPGGHFYLDACREEVLADLSLTLAPLLSKELWSEAAK